MMILDPRQRNGVILLVVITLLTLFAVLGIGFVMYANTTAEGARLGREAQTELRPDVEPELLLSYFLGQLIYDCPDDATGVYSALRGHSLARSMYGLNYDLQDLANPTRIASLNSTPYHGTGRLRNIPSGIPNGLEDYYVINYTFFPSDGILRDPERPGARSGTGTNPLAWGRNPFIGGYNAPYTYPDLNNMYLAAMKSDGTLMSQSFHRPWEETGPQSGRFFGPLDPSNLNWLNSTGKYKILRPRPIDHLTQANVVQAGLPWPLLYEDLDEGQKVTLQTLMQRLLAGGKLFPYPADARGDVKNLIGYPGGNDSLWLDLDAPIMTAPDGRKYKPLFAPLVLDLDNRVNLNVHGNARALDLRGGPGGTRVHASNQGWGPWEVNPAYLGGLNDPSIGLAPTQTEWTNMFVGTAAPNQRGRAPTGTSLTPPPPPRSRGYSAVDFDAINEATRIATDAMRLPGPPPMIPWQTYPLLPPGYGNSAPAELTEHPIFANPYSTTPWNYVFPLSNIEALLRYGDTGSPALTSEIFRLAPVNFGTPGSPEFMKRRNLVTMLSADVDRPGVTPFFWTATNPRNPYYHYLRVPEPQNPTPPTGPLVPFTFDPNVLRGETEYGPDWRTKSTLTALRRLDLNRYLPPYPPPNSQTLVINDRPAAQVAIRARQYMAKELFDLLCRVTGAGTPSDALWFRRERWEAFRWLAQLAVNIVDYIDADECITPFQWHRSAIPLLNEWVYGTELPRLVINEVYLQHNNYDDGLYPRPPLTPEQATKFLVSSWVELVNPLPQPPDPNTPDRNAALLATGGANPYPVYQLEFCRDTSAFLRQPNNTRGDLSLTGGLRATVPFLGPPRSSVQPSNGRFAGAGPNEGFHVVGPDLDGVEFYGDPGGKPQIRPSFAAPGMCYESTGALPTTCVLRRLACPNLPENNNPASPLYNPYVTVDYVEEIPVRLGDARRFTNFGAHDGYVPLEARHSIGRLQPFAARKNLQRQQQPNPAILAGQPQNSFYHHNVDATTPGPNRPPNPHPDYPPFDWLVHLDRPLISPMELVHVSAFKPHELTQQFYLSDDQESGPRKHTAPWFDKELKEVTDRSHRLYRVFEFLTTRHLSESMGKPSLTPPPVYTPIGVPGIAGNVVQPQAMSGPTMSSGTWAIEKGMSVLVRSDAGEEVVRVGAVTPTTFVTEDAFIRAHTSNVTVQPLTVSDRIPGKININTIWDKETFMALCDPQMANGNGFTYNDVDGIFDDLIRFRTPHPDREPREGDRPFLGMGVGNHTPGSAPFGNGSRGINDTWFCAVNRIDGIPNDRRLLHPDNPHPHHYFQNQLLHKIYNHLTTRSNVFAVWVTVGFFEVIDDTSRPVKLGAELTLADGSTRRHRMFAVVDRSVMTANPGPQRRFRLGTNPANAWTTGLVVPYYSIIQ